MTKRSASAVAVAAVLAFGTAACRDGDEPTAVPREVEAMTETTRGTHPAGDGGNGTVVTTGESPESGPPYLLAPTRRCLEAAGAAVSTIGSTDSRLRELGDLAQRTSLEIHVDGRILGLAFGDTRLLASLLRTPDDPYRLEVRRNALIMFKPAAADQAAVVRSCLRS